MSDYMIWVFEKYQEQHPEMSEKDIEEALLNLKELPEDLSIPAYLKEVRDGKPE